MRDFCCSIDASHYQGIREYRASELRICEDYGRLQREEMRIKETSKQVKQVGKYGAENSYRGYAIRIIW